MTGSQSIHEAKDSASFEERGNEYILPIKVDDVELPGFQPMIGYMPISKGTERIAEAPHLNANYSHPFVESVQSAAKKFISCVN
jgi:hypothetical protein